MQRVLVVDKTKRPLMPCHPARAKMLLKRGRAAVLRRYPFTIILKDREGGAVQPVRFKIDPGAKTTGIALVAEFACGLYCVWAGELTHRGQQIRAALLKRRQVRRNRRSRKTRYRPARFANRRRPAGWLPPSLQSRVANVLTWLKRLCRWVPLSGLAMELARFDMQKLQNPEISGVEYQQGELLGYEVREYLLEKWGRKCAYCGAANVALQVEHLTPKARGGSNRVSNLTIACQPCNQRKGGQSATEFGYPHLQAQAQLPLHDAAAVNTTRWALFQLLQITRLPLEVESGGRTKFNRVRQGYAKTHWLDAVCVGISGANVFVAEKLKPLLIAAKGHGTRQRCRPDAYGFPIAHAPSRKHYLGFQTGDIVKAVIARGKHAGIHIGRVAIRHRPSFRLNGFDVHPQYLSMVHQADGYEY